MMLKNTAATRPRIVCSVLYSFIADYRILPYYYCFSALLPSWIINGVGAASPNFLFGNPEIQLCCSLIEWGNLLNLSCCLI